MTITNEGQMPWIKFNPEEWLGYCNGMTDTELGLFHRVLAKLWKSPSLTLPLDALRRQLRITDGDPKDDELRGLIGLGLTEVDGLICIPPLTAAFEDAVQRSRKASMGGQAKAQKAQAKPKSPLADAVRPQPKREEESPDDIDF